MDYSFDQMAGMDQLVSGINEYGTFSDIPASYFDPGYWSADAFSSPSNYAPVVERGSAWAPQQENSLLSGLVGALGGWGGVASLGLGGLSQLLNMRAQDKRHDLEKKLAKSQIAASENAQKMAEAGYGDDFAKMHALAQIIQSRQGINLDPSLAYAQALRRKYGGSPDNANDFPGVDIGGPMRVGLSSEDRLDAINAANPAAVNFRAGGLGLLRGGTSGQADQINAQLSDGEYVIDADVVAALGDGNTEAGARKLDQMREQVRRHKRSASHKSIPPAAKDPMKYMRG